MMGGHRVGDKGQEGGVQEKAQETRQRRGACGLGVWHMKVEREYEGRAQGRGQGTGG